MVRKITWEKVRDSQHFFLNCKENWDYNQKKQLFLDWLQIFAPYKELSQSTYTMKPIENSNEKLCSFSSE